MSKKDIEFDELYSLPEGWEWAPLEGLMTTPKQDIVDGPFGSNLKASEYTDEGVPIARLQNIDRNQFIYKNIKFVSEEKAEYLDRHNFRPGDILITKLGYPLGEACIAPEKINHGIIVADLVRVRVPVDGIDKKYLTYAINSPFLVRQFEKHTKGTTRPRVNLGVIRELPIPVAPREQQKRIVAEIEKQFSRLDEAVDNLKRVKANLKRYKAAILKAAVEGKLTEEWRKQHPDVEPADKLLERILAERREKWQGRGKYKEPVAPDTTDMPELPEGWVWVSLGQVIDEPKYGTSKKCDYSAGDVGVLRIPNVVNGFIDSDDLKSTDFDDKEMQTYALKAGDILTIRSNGSVSLVGQCALVRDSDTEFLYAGYLIRIRPTSEEVSSEYLMACMLSRLLRQQIEAKAKSTSGVNNINSGELQSLVIPLCSREEQVEIVKGVESMISVV